MKYALLGLLNLGKFQSRDFTEQIASISLCALQYNILGYVKRFDSYETIGGLFEDVTLGTRELSIVEKIWLLIVNVVAEIAEQVSADYEELMESAINQSINQWKSASKNTLRTMPKSP